MKSDKFFLQIIQKKPGDNPNNAYEMIRVIEKETGKVITIAYYCKNAYQLFGYHFNSGSLNENETGIVFDDLYADLMNTNPKEFEAMLMHEVGHLINGDLDAEKSDDEIVEERLLGIISGKVDTKELAADRFAVEHCGKNAVLRMLDHVMMTRKNRHTTDEALALRELELRKQAVIRM